MKFEVTKHIEIENPILEVYARVRYWEDTTVNGEEDKDGSRIPFRNGDFWHPRIDVKKGLVLNWPQGVEARVHYKVADDGKYFLWDGSSTKLKYTSDYVPNDFLCHGDNGYGDYIIMNIDGNGKIDNYRMPDEEQDRWEICSTPNI